MHSFLKGTFMRILPISFTTPNIALRKKQENISNPIEQSEKRNVFAYQDYNISFMGRTPEDFYAQDFNRKNMPKTMRDYLDYDYNTRQHIPPEQMMAEVFKYIDKVDNFEYVKGLYPEEDLFKDLHENNIKSRKGILSEIAVVKELGTEPLLKNGSDNFGMYLLRKIYLEGKTLKEISKDFYENDLNDEYKEYIKEPITYSTLSAYGIKYPKQAFWHSFIHTRDEYKKFFVTLPKDSYAPGVNKSGLHSGTHSAGNVQEDDAPRPRKHIMKSHERTNLENDLNKGPIDEDGVKRAVSKRFGKDNPQASFIIKYMSPIMTVAAERIHLSEEMKIFTEDEKLNGKSSNEKTMFGRFWKQNPELRKQYSRSIVDTIDMFEDIYGGGGNIPINAQLGKISNPKNPNNKILDYVSGEFLDLLTYAQGIEGNRNARYKLHDRIKNVMEYKSAKRFEEEEMKQKLAISQDEKPEITLEENPTQLNPDDYTKICTVHTKDGNTLELKGDLNKGFEDYLEFRTVFMPSKYARKYINYIKENPRIPNAYKLSASVFPYLDQIDDPEIMTFDEFKGTNDKLDEKFFNENYIDDLCASQAVTDLLFKVLGDDHIPGYAYELTTFNYHISLISHRDKEPYKDLINTIIANKNKIDEIYESYTQPLSKQEMNKVTNNFMNRLYNYEPNSDSILDNEKQALILMIKDAIKSDKNIRSKYRDFMQKTGFKRHTYLRSLLDPELSEKSKAAKFELSMNLFVGEMVNDSDPDNIFLILVGRRNYEKYKRDLSPGLRNLLDRKIAFIPTALRLHFEQS